MKSFIFLFLVLLSHSAFGQSPSPQGEVKAQVRCAEAVDPSGKKFFDCQVQEITVCAEEESEVPEVDRDKHLISPVTPLASKEDGWRRKIWGTFAEKDWGLNSESGGDFRGGGFEIGNEYLQIHYDRLYTSGSEDQNFSRWNFFVELGEENDLSESFSGKVFVRILDLEKDNFIGVARDIGLFHTGYRLKYEKDTFRATAELGVTPIDHRTSVENSPSEYVARNQTYTTRLSCEWRPTAWMALFSRGEFEQDIFNRGHQAADPNVSRYDWMWEAGTRFALDHEAGVGLQMAYRREGAEGRGGDFTTSNDWFVAEISWIF